MKQLKHDGEPARGLGSATGMTMDDAETIGQTKKSSLPQNICKPAKSIEQKASIS